MSLDNNLEDSRREIRLGSKQDVSTTVIGDLQSRGSPLRGIDSPDPRNTFRR
jgi:hypothetical protein